ncbi:MAG: hypothetical protein JEZ06_10110 [Anaerolineaceae bacterium]|nr:hypothetical protein [Anaerolineaceae bacterium]
MRAIVSAAIAIAVGLILLLGYFLPHPLLQDLRVVLLGWGVSLAGVAALVGVINLIQTHTKKLQSEKNRDLYSFFLVIAFIITLVAGLILKPDHPEYQKIVTSIQVPVETSLMAVLAVTLAFSSLRLLQRRKGWMSIVFMISVVIFLIGSSGVFPALAEQPVFSKIFIFFQQLPMAGARGILLGIALGSLATGIRILIGAERPYSG